MQAYKFLEVLTRPQKKKMILLFLFMVFVTFIELFSIGSILPIFSAILSSDYIIKINSFLSKLQFVDYSFQNHKDLVVFSLVFLFSIFTLKNFFLLFFNWFQQNFCRELTNHLSNSLFSIFINQPYKYYFNAKHSELVRNINGEPINLVKNILIPINLIVMESIILLGLIFFLIALYGKNIGFVLFGIVLIILTFLYISRNIIKKWGTKRFEYEGKRIKAISQSFDSIKDIILGKKNNFFINKFKNFTNITNEASMYGAFYRSLPKMIIEQLVIILFIIFFFYNYSSQELNPAFYSKLIFLGAILIRLIPSFIRISISYQSIRLASTPQEKIYKFLQLNKSITHDKKNQIEFNKFIKFKNINYNFEGYQKKVLENISLQIEKNQTVGIIGTTGSGKTTFLDIFLGLLQPSSGSIFIDDKDFTYSLDSVNWQNKIGYVSQNVILMDDTIKNNIALGIEESLIDLESIDKAINKANLREFINSLPNGIDTNVGEKGVKLSGGQIQRIGIARALYFDPDILCLDEATSSLDYKTENEILKTIVSLKKNKTVLIIAHRLKTIENCDKIIELTNGKINKITTPKEMFENVKQ
jgi:ABC-type multidrug transport system fused ATPase/permease subunit